MTSLTGARRGSERARRRLRWLVPVGVIGVIVAGVEITRAASSSASPTLPPKTAQQLVAAVVGAQTEALSGQITEVSNFGLPSLPGSRSDASLTWQSYLTGSHTVRIWVRGPEQQRTAVLGELSESDVIHNGTDLWTYTSATNAVSHTVLTAAAPTKSDSMDAQPSPADSYNPASIATRILKAITPSTTVAVDPAQRVAGRATYTLDIRPRDSRSTVREATIAVDARTSTPLRVQVFGAGAAPPLASGSARSRSRSPVPPFSTSTRRPEPSCRKTRSASRPLRRRTGMSTAPRRLRQLRCPALRPLHRPRCSVPAGPRWSSFTVGR